MEILFHPKLNISKFLICEHQHVSENGLVYVFKKMIPKAAHKYLDIPECKRVLSSLVVDDFYMESYVYDWFILSTFLFYERWGDQQRK